MAIALTLAAPPAQAQAVDTGHIQADLLSQGLTAPPGGTVYVALRQKIAKGWHTYWRNPGDAGQETQIAWTLPAGWKAGDIVWATPQRLPLKTLMDYGYTGQVVLPVAITVPPDAKAGQVAAVGAAVSFLVCEELCIPESAKLALKIKVADAAPATDPKGGPIIAQALAAAPKPAGLKAVMARQGDILKLAVTGPALKAATVKEAYFYPYAATVIDHGKPQTVERGPQGLTLTLTAGYDFTKGKPPQAISGVLDLGGRAYEVTAKAGALPPGAAGLGAVAGAKGDGSPGGFSLPLALAFAFLGGVILNLMPCVFPVLSMKAAALAGHAHEPRQARSQGLAFLAGVMAAFLALAGALIAARAGGEAVGWGFQLQSPAVVASLCLLMLLVALNLSGVFEIGASLQGAGGGLASRSGLAGAAFTGALAVVVAAPCTAPFMAGALGYALTQPAPVSLLVFACLGLGFAAPFTLLAFAPALLQRLPKPGAWMDTLRRCLAFPMYAAAAWLAWVFAVQAGDQALAALFGAGVVLAFAAWLFGHAQGAALLGQRPVVSFGAAGVAALAAVALVVVGVQAPRPAEAQPAAGGAGLQAIAFTPERLAELRQAGKPVLVDFTAAWCVTCQVNERLALSTSTVADAFARTGGAYMKADWTNRDAGITQLLAEHGRAGVPLYLVYGGGREAVVLPQLLTEGEVVAAIEAAAQPS